MEAIRPGTAPTLPQRARAAAEPAPGAPLEKVHLNGLLPLETPKDAVETLVEGYGYAEFPQCSPDGKRIVFNVVGDYDTSQMLIMNADGSDVRSLFSGRPLSADSVQGWLKTNKGKTDEQGSWSSDGRAIYYRSNEKGTFGIAKFDLGNRKVAMIVHDPALNMKHPGETHDGWIVGYGGPPGKQFKTSEEYSDIFLANPADGSYRLITHSDGSVAYKHPSLIHGMVVAHREPRGGTETKSDLVQIDPRDGSEINLTKTPDADEKHPFYNDKVGLLTFHSDESGDKNIWISTPDTTRRVQLTFYGRAAQSPGWSPDGSTIYFVKKLERQAEGEPFFARQADIRAVDVKKALKDLAKQAKARWQDLRDRGSEDAAVSQARKSYEDYKYFLSRYDK
ncbi:MAG: hypothetical protein FJX76_24160 [Armatimonadetes bacterium]|nr:hypothetical protein [Armatimonadota bacterium]